MASAAASELKLETSEKMSDPVIHAFHKLGMFLVKSGLVWVPIARLGSKADFHFATLDSCNMNQVPDCRQSCAVALRVFLLPDGV